MGTVVVDRWLPKEHFFGSGQESASGRSSQECANTLPPSALFVEATVQIADSCGHWESHSWNISPAIQMARAADCNCSRGKDWPGEYTSFSLIFPSVGAAPHH